MKLLLVADLHYTLRQWDWLAEAAGKFDLVVVAGDLLDLGSIVPLEAQVVVVRKYLQRLRDGPPVLVTSGNHDVLAHAGSPDKDARWLQSERSPELRVDGDGFERDGLFFSLLPWWETPADIERIEAQLEADAERAGGKRWFWIYHPPPVRTAVAWSGRDDWGDDQLPGWIRRHAPEAVLGGHVHQAPFVRDGAWVDELDGTWLFNGGRQPGGVPTFTVIDTERRRAVWVSTEGAEQADLELPLERVPFDGPIRL